MKLFDVVRAKGELDIKRYEDVSIEDAVAYVDNNSFGMSTDGKRSWFIISDPDGNFRGHYFSYSRRMNVVSRN